MSITDSTIQPYIATIEPDGHKLHVSCRIAYDGVEYVGRLWFADDGFEDTGIPDRAALPGRSHDEVIALARRLGAGELVLRYRRALAEKRRFKHLRAATDEILTKIRYLNQVAISMRAGLLDEEGAAQEVDLIEKQLHECVDRLKTHAGVES
ncbi:MAG TPA: hypothetical protein VFK16_03220 [Gemmatimonadaceae bacterium]|jgi:hypothetical protein|nr:hypothetical protein [Gemmatimonadaceae bacterium]